MKDKRLKRVVCPVCGRKCTVGPANRIYKHNTLSGDYCNGHGIKCDIVNGIAVPVRNV